MNEPIRLELTDDEWLQIALALNHDISRNCCEKTIERCEQVLNKLERARYEWEQNRIRERVKK